MINKSNISIVEAGGNWYLGFNNQLDKALLEGHIAPFRLPRRTTLGDAPFWLKSPHSESNALRELYHDTENLNAIRGTMVHMVSTQSLCGRWCVNFRQTMKGQLQDGLINMNLDMDVWFIRQDDLWSDTHYISTFFPER